MPTLRLELPADMSKAAIDALQTELEPHGDAYELPSPGLDLMTVILGISFVSDVLQEVDVLVNWLQLTPQANKAVILSWPRIAIRVRSQPRKGGDIACARDPLGASIVAHSNTKHSYGNRQPARLAYST